MSGRLPPRVDVVIPLHDEAEAAPALFRALDRLTGLLAEEGCRAGYVLVDDGSTDATLELLHGHAQRCETARVVSWPHRRGVGAAMREGFRATEAEAVVCYDADCTYPIEDIPRLLEGLSRGEVVTAVPVLPADREARPPLVRRLLTRAVALAYRVVLGRGAGGVTVFTCAFRAYRRPAILACLPRSDGFSAAAEILSRALLQGLTVAEVPSVLGKRVHGRSKMRVVRAGLGHARVLGCGLLWRLGWPRSPRHG